MLKKIKHISAIYSVTVFVCENIAKARCFSHLFTELF